MCSKYLKNIGLKDHQSIDGSGLSPVPVGLGLPTFSNGGRDRIWRQGQIFVNVTEKEVTKVSDK